MRLFYVYPVPGIIISVPLRFSFGQITQEDIRKTYGGSSGSRGYYSSAFARSVVYDICMQHLLGVLLYIKCEVLLKLNIV